MAPLSTLGFVVLLLSFSSFASVGSVGVEIIEQKNKIRCKVPTSEPTKWWKDGEVIDTDLDKYHERPDDNNLNNLCLNFTFTTDDEGNYSCINDSDPVQLTVDPQITGSSFNATFDDDGNIIIPCGLKAGSITANKKLRFYIEDLDKKLSGESIKEKEGESYNMFFVANSSQYGSFSKSHTYRCKMEGEKGSNYITLRVPPNVTIRRDDGSSNFTLLSGESLRVSCNASHPDANSTNTVTKTWKKNDESILSSNDSELFIAQLSSTDSGVYTCLASFDGLEYSKSFNLTVGDLPSPSPSTIESPSTTEPPSTTASPTSKTSIPTTPSQATEISPTGTVNPTSKPSKGLETTLMYAIIIIVLLITVMVLLAAMTLCYLLHCCMKRKRQNESESSSRTGDVELQANQNQDSIRRPPLNPSMTSSANDRLTIGSSSCCESCRCTPSIAPSSINPSHSDQSSLGHNPSHIRRPVSTIPSHCTSTATCTCSCTRSNNMVPPYYPMLQIQGPHPPFPHHALISMKPANPSISNDSGYSVYYPPSETGTTRGYPDTRTVCSHCTKSFIPSIDSGYHPMRYSSGLPGYSSEGTVC